MGLLPAIATESAFDTFAADEPAVRAVLDVLADRLGLAGPLQRPTRGSAIVGMNEGQVVKLMAPHDAALSRSEAGSLRTLEGRLPVPVPRLIDTGELEGWPWIVMSRLRGEELVDVWPGLSRSERLSLATQLGEALAALHITDAPPEIERVDWSLWCADHLADLEGTQRGRGCPEALLDGLTAFVAGADLDPGRRGWLHTEVMREHLLVTRSPTGWRLSGLFDFEPSWVAPVDYEFASVGIFVSAGEPAVLKEILRSAGVVASPRRLFSMAMLHRYANLGWYHQRLGGSASPEALAQAWFGQEI